MRKIKWKPMPYSSSDIEAKVGGVTLKCCHSMSIRGGRHLWYAMIYIDRISISTRMGPDRHSLSKTKEDAIRLAEELLVDYQTDLAIELKNFDISE